MQLFVDIKALSIADLSPYPSYLSQQTLELSVPSLRILLQVLNKLLILLLLYQRLKLLDIFVKQGRSLLDRLDVLVEGLTLG